MGIIDGRQWRRDRQRHLQAELEDAEPDHGLSDDQRAAIQAELAALDGQADHDRRRWWRWFALGGRPPGQ